MTKQMAAAWIMVVVFALVAPTGCGNSHPKSTVSAFLALAEDGEYEGAYALLSESAKGKTSLAEFTSTMQDRDAALGRMTRFKYAKGYLGAEQSSMVFAITRTKDGKDNISMATFSMLLESGRWRITGGF